MTLLYPQKLALTSPTTGGRSVGTVRSRTQATEFEVSGAAGRASVPVRPMQTKFHVNIGHGSGPVR
jgi:hypothetical protein